MRNIFIKIRCKYKIQILASKTVRWWPSSVELCSPYITKMPCKSFRVGFEYSNVNLLSLRAMTTHRTSSRCMKFIALMPFTSCVMYPVTRDIRCSVSIICPSIEWRVRYSIRWYSMLLSVRKVSVARRTIPTNTWEKQLN